MRRMFRKPPAGPMGPRPMKRPIPRQPMMNMPYPEPKGCNCGNHQPGPYMQQPMPYQQDMQPMPQAQYIEQPMMQQQMPQMQYIEQPMMEQPMPQMQYMEQPMMQQPMEHDMMQQPMYMSHQQDMQPMMEMPQHEQPMPYYPQTQGTCGPFGCGYQAQQPNQPTQMEYPKGINFPYNPQK